MKRSGRRLSEAEKVAAWEFKLSAKGEGCGCCGLHPSDVLGAIFEVHHVIYQQHVRGKGGDLWDQRNGLFLCADCHHAQHNGRGLPLHVLRDENYDFAFELLGPAAYDYLKRRYAGEDPRLDALLERQAA